MLLYRELAASDQWPFADFKPQPDTTNIAGIFPSSKPGGLATHSKPALEVRKMGLIAMSEWKMGNERIPIRPYVDMAIAKLGFVKSDSAGAITDWMAQQHRDESWDARRLRRTGIEMTAAEKKAAGLRGNVRFTREAWDMLTEEGRKEPIRNLETTLQHALFAIWKEHHKRQLDDLFANGRMDGIFEGIAVQAFHNSCDASRAIEDHVFSPNSYPSLPVVGCDREICGCNWRTVPAWKAKPIPEQPIPTGWVMKALPDETPAPPPKRSWLARLFRR